MTKAPKKISLKKGSLKTQSDSKFVKTVKDGLETPEATLIFCALAKPHYFAGSAIPRYKIQLEFDPKKKEHKKFLETLEEFARAHEVEHLGRMSDDGTIIITYQGKEVPKLYMREDGKKRSTHIELEHDMPSGIKCSVNFDLKRYVERHSKKNAFTFPPRKVTFYLDDEMQDLIEVEDGDNSSGRV